MAEADEGSFGSSFNHYDVGVPTAKAVVLSLAVRPCSYSVHSFKARASLLCTQYTVLTPVRVRVVRMVDLVGRTWSSEKTLVPQCPSDVGVDNYSTSRRLGRVPTGACLPIYRFTCRTYRSALPSSLI